jgi:hypothetical protein
MLHCAIILCMSLSRSFRKFGHQVGNQVGKQVERVASPHKRTHLLRNVGWISAGVTALALGVVVGREIRQRYKFNRRTPYDLYAHSGDQVQDVDFGVGI